MIVLGIATGLHKELLVPSFFGALMSLKKSKEAKWPGKFFNVITSTVAGMLGGVPLASMLGVFLPSAAEVPPAAAKYVVAGMIAYGGLALIDRWLFPAKEDGK